MGIAVRLERLGLPRHPQPVLPIDQELVVRYPPRVVRRHQVGDAARRHPLQRRGGQALDAVGVHKVRLEALQHGVHRRGHQRVERNPVHVFPLRAPDGPHGNAAPGVALGSIGCGVLVVAAEHADLVAIGVAGHELGCLVAHDAGGAPDRLRREEHIGQQQPGATG